MKRWRAVSHLFEVSAAVVFVSCVVAYAIYVPPQSQIDQKWIGLFFNSLFVFGLSLAMARKRGILKQPLFWLIWFPLLGLHCSAFYFVLARTESWPLVRYIPSDALEIALLEKLISTLPGVPPSKQGS
jgi:hypothetical protein